MKKSILFVGIAFCTLLAWHATTPKFEKGDYVGLLMRSTGVELMTICCAKVSSKATFNDFCKTKTNYCYALSELVCDGQAVTFADPDMIIYVGEEALILQEVCPAIEETSEPVNVHGIY